MLIRIRRGWVLLALALGFAIIPDRGGRFPPLPQFSSASAQSDLQAVISPPVVESFPRIVTYLDIHNSQGFVHGLEPGDIRILENEQPLPAAELRELQPGVQFLVVVNPAPSFRIRNSRGKSRFDAVSEAIQGWARNRQGSTLDDLSLILAEGPEVTHVSDPLEMIEPLESYEFDAETVEAGVDILVSSLDVANDPTPREGMERAVLMVTGLPQEDLTFGIQNISSLAAQGDVKLFIWLVASPEVFGTPGANQLAELAASTGGHFLTFSGEEELPNIEQYLASMRSIYYLAYDSRISVGGTHQVAVEVQVGDQVVTTPPHSFNFDLRPPDVAFISPPVEIVRQIPPEDLPSPLESPNPADLEPEQAQLQVLVHFPDGTPRDIAEARFYVDGVLVEERREPPFDLFTWDLSPYITGGQHSLQVEVVDSLGLSGASILTPIEVVVVRPEISPLAALLPRWPILLTLGVLVVAAVLLLALILGGRIGPQARYSRQRKLQAASAWNEVEAVPEERPESLKLDAAGKRLSGWVNRLHWPQRRLSPNASAFLVRSNDQEDGGTQEPIPITAAEITIGRDVHLATLVIDDPSLDGLHARLVRDEEGCFHLVDENTVAGTWINYTPVSNEGAPLEHGDLIHVGRVAFRFIQREPSRPRRPVVREEQA